VGHLAAWNYFMSLNNPVNEEFKRKWAAFARARNIAGHRDRPLTNDPMEATYVGVNMWKQAVEKARSIEVDAVRVAMRGQTFQAPSGFELKMDEQNHHLHKPVLIGEVRADGQFNVVWRTRTTIRAQPWSPFIEGNDRRPATPQRST
jgi:urea transport system substrate-binding protein